MENKKQLPSWFYMASLIFVILMWGTMPVITKKMYIFFSPTVYTTLMGLTAGIAMFFISFKHLRRLSRELLKISIPTGIINALAAILQKIGLQYTTPTKCAFLDTLSCITVPIMLFILTRKRPTPLKLLAAFLCLSGCFVLTGVRFGDFSAFGIGEILCALAGILYGVNIAITGIYAQKIFVPLHVMIHMGVQVVTGSIMAVLLHFITVNGQPMEQFRFTFAFKPILFMILIGLVASALGWMIRINALKKIDPTVVGVMMPMSSVVTGFVSVLFGTDALTARLLIGGALGTSASIVSNLSSGAQKTKRS